MKIKDINQENIILVYYALLNGKEIIHSEWSEPVSKYPERKKWIIRCNLNPERRLGLFTNPNKELYFYEWDNSYNWIKKSYSKIENYIQLWNNTSNEEILYHGLLWFIENNPSLKEQIDQLDFSTWLNNKEFETFYGQDSIQRWGNIINFLFNEDKTIYFNAPFYECGLEYDYGGAQLFSYKSNSNIENDILVENYSVIFYKYENRTVFIDEYFDQLCNLTDYYLDHYDTTYDIAFYDAEQEIKETWDPNCTQKNYYFSQIIFEYNYSKNKCSISISKELKQLILSLINDGYSKKIELLDYLDRCIKENS